jgi:CRP-like cAMP-binding protein
MEAWSHDYCLKITDFVQAHIGYFEYAFYAQRVRRNQIIYLMDDPADRLFRVQEGSVRLTTIGEDGREEVLRIVRAGQFFGAVCLCPDYRWDHQATVHEDGVIASMKAKTFLRVFFRHEDLLQRFLAFFAERMVRLEDRLRQLTETLVQLRLLHFLDQQVQQAGVEGTEARVTISGWSRVVAQVTELPAWEVEKLLQQFRQEGLLDWKRNTVLIRVDRLRARFQELLARPMGPVVETLSKELSEAVS